MWRLVMPTLETLSAIKKLKNALTKQPQNHFPISKKSIESVIHGIRKGLEGL